MFGQLIQELNQLVIDNEVRKFLDKANKLNDLRIHVVHKLTKSDKIITVKNRCKKVKTLFNEVWELFDAIYDNYRVTFKDYNKDIEELKEEIE